MRRSRVRGWAAAGSVILVASTGACSMTDVSEAGSVSPAQTLTLGVADPPGRLSWELAEEFARRIRHATSGSVVVDVTNEGTETPKRWNQALAERARKGDLDLALVQAQSWDALGVDSLSVLFVPFLIRDEEVLDAIATSALADDLLAGLEGTGVSALALLPGGLRRIVAEDGPVTLPAELEGRGVRVAYSETTWAIFAELAARPMEPNGEDEGVARRNGTFTALDTTFALADSHYSAPQAIADVSTHPLAFTLVANDDAMAGLSRREREVLHRVARDLATWAAQTRPSEADEARALCQRAPRSRVVVAGAEARATWLAATRGLALRLRGDPAVDTLARRIEQLASTVGPAPPVAACQGKDRPAAARHQPNVPASFPEGIYRREVSAQELIDVGVNESDAHGHAGTWVLPFLPDGRYGDGPGCPGSRYEIVQERVVVTSGPEGPDCGAAAGKVLFSAGWRLQGARLTLTDVRSGHGSDQLVQALFGGGSWTRIG